MTFRLRRPLAALVLAMATLYSAGAAIVRADDPQSPIARWRLGGDARDVSGNGHDGDVHGANLSATGPHGGAAAFNGRNDFIEVPPADQLALGTRDFSIAAWVHTSAELDDALGDVVSCYDAAGRRGFTLGFLHNAGVASNQSNSRNIHFGIDAGSEPRWTDCGRPGEAVLAFAFAVFEGRLYAGTCEAGRDQAGHVYRYDRDDRWIDCGSPDPANSITSLAVYKGRLYAGASKYRLGGSALAESENPYLGGKVYRYEADGVWNSCGELPGREAIGGMLVYRGQLYASSLYRPAGFFRYDEDQTWTELPSPGGLRVEALGMHDGQIFASSYDGAHVYRFEGQEWTDCGQLGPVENTQTYCFATYGGELHAGTWRTGRVYRYAGDNDWRDAGRLGEELEVMGMAAFNGKLYAGSLPLAEVYRFDDGETWTRIAQIDHTPDVTYRRVWTMAEFQGRLFCSTLPSGRVHALQAGESVSYDYELPAGWTHVAAVKAGDRLRLFVNGELAAESTPFDPAAYNLTNGQSWRIGFGPHDYFNGRLADVRVYDRALDAIELRPLATRPADE